MISFIEEKIFIYSQAIDMRKGLNGLCLLLSAQGIHPQEGGLYLFSNRAGRAIKGLFWDRNGFLLIYKRIETGRFKIVFDETHGMTLELNPEQLGWLLAGLDYSQQRIFPELKIKYFY